MSTVSVVIPCYNEEEAVPLFYEAFLRDTQGMPVAFELLFVDDGSRDGTLCQLEQLSQKDERVHYLSFSRNFGKESAMFAGMEAATGDYVAIMDVDLQDPPSLLPRMLEAIQNEGYDCNPQGRAAYPQLFCPRLLPADQPHQQNRNCGRRA